MMKAGVWRAASRWIAGLAGMTVCAVAVANPPSTARAERLRFDADHGAWVEIPAAAPGTAEGDLAVARSMFTDGKHRNARGAMRRWHKQYGESSDLYPDALLLSAQIDKALRDYYVAGQLLDQIIEDYPGIATAREALVEIFNVAEVFLSGVRRKVWGIPLLRADDWALDVLDRISTEYTKDPLAELAVKTKGDYYYGRGDFSLAELEYARVLQDFPASRYRQYSMRRAADSAVASFNGILFDDAPLVEAEERFRQYVSEYPGVAEQEGVSLQLQDIREKRASKEFEVGDYYQRTGHLKAAAFYYQSVLTHWPETVAARRSEGAIAALPPTLAPDQPPTLPEGRPELQEPARQFPGKEEGVDGK
ncbi:MAG: outer membrane protein assembly factor BamD [Phycisphaerales bacterium]|nr:outer membrane protein assembly factor BamD [Phycisphaerales bacterium]